MIAYPHISPEIFSFGRLKLRWYGLMYVIGYTLAYQVLKYRARKGLVKMNYRACESLITYNVLGMLVGARLVYIFVYNWGYYKDNLNEIFYLWQGGLSFHGAAIGMIVACTLFARNFKLPFYSVTDCLAGAAAPGLFFGRMGNFINAELFGRQSNVAWAMIFPTDKLQVPRHPSQLYEAFFEGIVLSVLVFGAERWAVKKGKYRDGIVGALFLIFYGVFRFFIEYTREPDAQLGLLWGGFSMGQYLCFIMSAAGIAVFVHMLKTQPVFEPKAPNSKFLNAEKPASAS